MDRPLTTDTIRARRRRTFIRVALVAAAILVVLITLSTLLRPSVSRSEIRTATVRRGSIEGSIAASGTTVPDFEQAISSPSETRLLAVRKHPGDAVIKGESILSLDQSELNLALERTSKELIIKENQKTQLRLDMERTLRELEGQLEIKKLRIEYLTSKRIQGEKMMEIGAISRDQMDQAKLEERIAMIERNDLEKSIESTQLSLRNQLESLTAEVGTLRGEKENTRRELELLECRAGRDGVVTWVRDEIGSSIHRGEVVCRIADLSRYHVEATLSDIHSSRLRAGMSAVIMLNEDTIGGTVSTVYPNVENGAARITISLADPTRKGLRPNLRVDVSLVTAKRDGVLLLKKGHYLSGAFRQSIFVVKGGTAVRTEITTGIVGFDDMEIVGGLAEGDEAIVSDMSEYEGHSEITIH